MFNSFEFLIKQVHETTIKIDKKQANSFDLLNTKWMHEMKLFSFIIG